MVAADARELNQFEADGKVEREEEIERASDPPIDRERKRMKGGKEGK